MKKTVIELFAGVGGFRVGLNDIHNFDNNGKAIENRDWKFVWANQWEPATTVQHAYDCYVTRFGNECSNEDISKVDSKDIPNHTLLCGGFPCQDYSVARSLSKEKGIEGKKGVLFWDIARILKDKETPFFLLENVDRLLKSPSKQRGRDFGIMLRTLSDLGYNVEWRIINAADYGAAQRRRRIFIFGWKKTMKYNENIDYIGPKYLIAQEGVFARAFPIEQEDSKYRCIDLLQYEDTVDITKHFKAEFENSGIMIDGKVWTRKVTPVYEEPITIGEIRENRKGLDKYILTGEKLKKFEYLRGGKKILRTRPDGTEYYYSEGSMSEYDSLDLPGRTMLTSEGSVNRSTHIIPDKETGKLRLLTPIEAERLQSFPDDWTNTGMPENRRYFMMGNALVTKVIDRVEPVLREIIEHE
ncbi:DNA (cytosine-5-)-methyltransferase [uncultured Solobacterium sp.]|jgi:modification methylase sau3AI|uniref:DNA (cytosine-5-)-methyltransferase n=1 Tax=uncultured Solobacterium sp. TaxID=747375 RepID=UPI0028E7691A|nr:DNA (cytosine-5-)-methyltransferase [uncultured Solobacterium sp.]